PRRRRSQAASPGGRATASTMPSAVSAPSAAWLEWSPARFTTTPVTGPVALVVVPVPVPPDVVVPAPALAELLAFGPPELELAPVATALPFFTTQFSGAPSFWHGDGSGAVASRMFLPFCMVGLLQLLSWLTDGTCTCPGILAFWISPPFTRLNGSGE